MAVAPAVRLWKSNNKLPMRCMLSHLNIGCGARLTRDGKHASALFTLTPGKPITRDGESWTGNRFTGVPCRVVPGFYSSYPSKFAFAFPGRREPRNFAFAFPGLVARHQAPLVWTVTLRLGPSPSTLTILLPYYLFGVTGRPLLWDEACTGNIIPLLLELRGRPRSVRAPVRRRDPPPRSLTAIKCHTSSWQTSAG